jgi:putative hemolysin
MLIIEQEIIKRFPEWFTGRKSTISKPLLHGYSKFCRLWQIDKFIAEHGHLQGQLLIAQALEYLNIRYSVDHIEKTYIPEKGRCLIIANHPAGVVDALALLHFVSSIRPDVKIVANEALSALGMLDDMIIPVDVFGKSSSATSIKLINEALQAEQCVIMFPAGEVSRIRPTGIKDTPWRTGFYKIAEKNKCSIVPVKITARNSALFYGLSMIYKPLGTLLLPREITQSRNSRFDLRIGKPQSIDSKQLEKPSLKAIRQSLYAIGTRKSALAKGLEPLIPAIDRICLKTEIKKLSLLGETPDGKQIYAGKIPSSSLLLQELGRLRELSFRAVGEGSGKRIDIDKFDTWYDHIILWDNELLAIIGAYRVADGHDVYAQHGLEGFYTASLFQYSCSTVARLVEGMELGRSFVVPDFWNSRSLDNLWIGIGAYLKNKPHVRYLYGPVSISAELPIVAREKIVAYYQEFYGCRLNKAKAHRPFQFLSNKSTLSCSELAMQNLKAELKELDVKIPTLYKQYTELCEKGGVSYLAFGIDPAFSNAVDGLIELDIEMMKPAKRKRYLQQCAELAPNIV